MKVCTVIVWVNDQGVARARDSATGDIIAEPSDHAAVIQAAVDRRGTYLIKRPIRFSDETRMVIRGELGYSSILSTILKVDSAFPDQRYVTECVRQNPSKTNAIIEIEDIYMWNPNWSSVRAGFPYWAGLAFGFHGGPKIRRCAAHSARRGIHIKGETHSMVVEDFAYLAAATMPAGSTSVTVAHGLLAAPSKVLVTPTANVGAV